MARRKDTEQIAIRLDRSLLRRADRLTQGEELERGPFSASYLSVTRTDVLRAAVKIGLAKLEEDHGLTSEEGED